MTQQQPGDGAPDPVRELRGEVDLVMPRDLFDVMAPEDPDAAVAEFRELFGEMFPRTRPSDRDVLARGLVAWRERLLAEGVVLHGLVAVPAGPETETPAHWHVLAGVVEVGAAVELDTGALAASMLGDELSTERTYTESFDTEMGWGVGLITQVPVTPVSETDAGAVAPVGDGAAGAAGHQPPELPPVMGLAAGLSAPRGGSRGLLVVGFCLDTDRTLEMAAIVAAIAGNSVIRRDESDHATTG